MAELTDAQKVVRNDTGIAIAEAINRVAGAIGRAGGVVYGFHIDNAESDPSEKVTYLADAVGMTPAYMNYTEGEFNYGSWENAFFMPKPCMLKFDGTVDYYLDPNDYTKKADGTASEVASSTTGNAMMEWGQNGKKIWYKIVPSGTKKSADVYIADHQEDGDYHAWSFINKDGKLVDHFYTPIYNGSVDSSERLRSLSGKSTLAGATTSTTNAAMAGYIASCRTATQERTMAKANNATHEIWDTEVYCDIVLINLLLILMSKSTDSQTAFGQGLVSSGSQTVNDGFASGVHNTKGLFYGTNSGAAATPANAVKVFGMENWWGFQWRRFAGLVNVSGTAKYKMTKGTQDGSTASDYVVSATAADYNSYIGAGSLPVASGTFVDAMQFDGNQFVPATVGGGSTTHYCDALWTNNGQVDYAFRGGASNGGASCGSFYLRLDIAVSAAGWDVTAAPSCKPLS